MHAAVRCGADDRQALTQPCCYITRPELAIERIQANATGQMVLKFKTPRGVGTTHLVTSPDARQSRRTVGRLKRGPGSARVRHARLSPLEFMRRLVALVPRPRPRQRPVIDPMARQLWQRMRSPGRLDSRDRIHRLRHHAQCFVGRDAVDWLVRHRQYSTGRAVVDWMVRRYDVPRATALQWATQLMRKGPLRHVFDDQPFRDDRSLYRVS